ncbi:ty3-gypsy retrotransposon protein [Cucumis melo var. makuwa]|uniref:Ty3-gypsy retrotransposon protein n=1 Tax=Cucumis melo var. makuwa TaxID=1194695 RepID=A0A5A7SME9_CUCMM|nr:ty3-gypsy retrotransposon protein [Cucumis melo var. makuwa]
MVVGLSAFFDVLPSRFGGIPKVADSTAFFDVLRRRGFFSVGVGSVARDGSVAARGSWVLKKGKLGFRLSPDMRIRDSDIPKADFRSRHWHYEFIVISFDSTNALIIFQHLMNRVFKNFLDTFVITFIDDILVCSKIEPKHEEHLHQVTCLGHVVSSEGVFMDPTKIEAGTSWPRPSTISEDLKQKLVTAPIFTMPDGSGSFMIYNDTFKKGFGCVLMQQAKVVVYASRQLKSHEQNYPLHDLDFSRRSYLTVAQLPVQSTLRQRIIVAQLNDQYFVKKHRLAEVGKVEEFSISSDDKLMFERRQCVPEDTAVKT